MADIPKQKIEMDVQIRLHDDALLNATIFPLLSHQYDNPIDTLESFLNRRQRDFFPARLRDGAEALIPLNLCYVVELSRRTVQEMIGVYTQMSDVSLVESRADVESFAVMSVTLTNKRNIKGTAWFHIHVPETERNIYDYVNRADRFLILHGAETTYFIRREAIQWVKAVDIEEALRSGADIPVELRDRRTSSLVDVKYRFSDSEALDDQGHWGDEESGYVDLPDHLAGQESYEAYQHAPLTPSRVVKKPSFDPLSDDPEMNMPVPPAGTSYPEGEAGYGSDEDSQDQSDDEQRRW